jgi:hypothetical protein
MRACNWGVPGKKNSHHPPCSYHTNFQPRVPFLPEGAWEFGEKVKVTIINNMIIITSTASIFKCLQHAGSLLRTSPRRCTYGGTYSPHLADKKTDAPGS